MAFHFTIALIYTLRKSSRNLRLGLLKQRRHLLRQQVHLLYQCLLGLDAMADEVESGLDFPD